MHQKRGCKKTSTLQITGRAGGWDLSAVPGFGIFGFSDLHLFFTETGAAVPWGILFAALIAGLLIFSMMRRGASFRSPVVRGHDRLLEALRGSESDLAETLRIAEAVVEALPEPVHFKTPEGRRIDVDEAWQKLFGISRTAFVGDMVRDLYSRKTGEAAGRVMPRSAGFPSRTQVFKTTIIDGNGERVDTIRRKSAGELLDNGGSGMIGAIISMVERKETGFFDMLGYAKEEISGKPIHDAAPAAGHGSGSLFGKDAVKDAMISLSTENRYAHTGGKVRWEQRTVSVVSNKNGSPKHLLCMAEDITERKLSEQRQRMEIAINRVLAESDSMSGAIPEMIQGICQSMEWRFGMCWILEAHELKLRGSWGDDIPELAGLVADYRQTVIKTEPVIAQNLVLRTFFSGKPVWIPDIIDDPGITNAHHIAKTGLRGGLGFPLLLGSKVLGVMEFYHRDAPEPNAALLTTMHSIGNLIGQYIVRMDGGNLDNTAAAYDALTKLPNREIFNQRLEHAFIQAQRRGTRLAVLFIDLDHFKLVNDTLGHEVGDTLLLEVARRLMDNLRASDTVARFGGDEFAVLVEDVSDPLYIGNLARKLIEALSDPYVIAGEECHISASIGSSTYPDDGEDAAALLKNADTAMYRAKEHGRNRFQFYSEELNANAMEQMTVEADLRRALERSELLLYYQPKIAARGGRVTGLEALVRWQHPEMGLVPPGYFMRIANESGLIVPIDEWVLRTACAASREWEMRGLPKIPVAVNVSRRQFIHGNLLRDVEQVLDDTGCSADCIALEITEGMVMLDPDRAIKLVKNLKKLGVQIVMDDFGTGYSSLALLENFPVDALKIDRSFMKIAGDKGTTSVAQAIIGVAHSLNFSVIAEGVETRQQFDFLRDLGCDEMQGHYVSRPLTAPDAMAFILENAENSSAA